MARRLHSEQVLEHLAWMFAVHGVPAYLRSDNGLEFTANTVCDWLTNIGVQTLYIEPGIPCKNGYVESFIWKLKDELIDREIFYTLVEAKMLIGRWRDHYNKVRPHSPLGYRPPAPEAIAFGVLAAGCATLCRASLRPPLANQGGSGLT